MQFILILKEVKQKILLFGDSEYIPVCRKCYEKLSTKAKKEDNS